MARTPSVPTRCVILLTLILCATLGLAGCDDQNGTVAYPDSSQEQQAATDSSTQEASSDDDFSAAQSIRQAAIDQSAAAASQAQAAAIKQEIEAIVAPYGQAVSVTYLPVGDTDGIVSVNGTTQHASASMIKLLVLAALLDKAATGEVDLTAQVKVASDDIVSGTGTIQNDGPGAYTVQELARRMIADSDNTATNVIVDLIGMDAVNEEASKLGLTGTVMARKMMDTAAAEGGMRNRMTTDDAATILNLIACGKLVNEQMSQLAMDFLLQQTIDAGLTDAIPAGVSVAHKTGELLQTEHDGGIVLAAKPYVLVVMTEGIENVTGVSVIADVSRAVYVATNGSDGVGEANTTAQGVQEAVDAAGGAEWAFDFDEPGVTYNPGDYTWEDGGGDSGWTEDDSQAGGTTDAGNGGQTDDNGNGSAEQPSTPSQGEGGDVDAPSETPSSGTEGETGAGEAGGSGNSSSSSASGSGSTEEPTTGSGGGSSETGAGESDTSSAE